MTSEDFRSAAHAAAAWSPTTWRAWPTVRSGSRWPRPTGRRCWTCRFPRPAPTWTACSRPSPSRCCRHPWATATRGSSAG
ncbi:hypothetical protein ACFQ1I_09715 [Kitasatospora arboriphila]